MYMMKVIEISDVGFNRILEEAEPHVHLLKGIEMNKTMNNLILCLILCSAVIYSGCVSNQTEEKTVTELTDIDRYIISKVSVRNGLSGELSTTDDRVKIIKLINHLDGYSLEKKENQEPMFGYRYSIHFYSGSNKISRIVIVDSEIMRVDEVYYDVIDSPIDIVTIDELVDSL